MISSSQIVERASQYLGTPFRHQGRNKHGVDCVGLVIVVGADLGIFPRKLDRINYGRSPSRGELEAKLYKYCLKTDKLVPGCVVAIRWNTELAHCAFYTGATLIHSYENAGGVVEHGFRGRWTRLVDSTWLLPGVDYGF